MKASLNINQLYTLMTKVLTEQTLRIHLNDNMPNGYYVTRGKLKTLSRAVYIHQHSDDSYIIEALGNIQRFEKYECKSAIYNND